LQSARRDIFECFNNAPHRLPYNPEDIALMRTAELIVKRNAFMLEEQHVSAGILKAHSDFDHDLAHMLDGYGRLLAEVVADIQGD
jgi:hypothetical protein